MSELVERVDLMHQVAELAMKGKDKREIATELNIKVHEVTKFQKEWTAWLKHEVTNNIDFAEKSVDLVFEALANYDVIKREAWATAEDADRRGQLGNKLNALKLATSIEDKKAHILTSSGVKTNSDLLAQLHQAQQVNEILSKALKTLADELPEKRHLIREVLAEAFAMRDEVEAIEVEAVE